VTHRVLRRGLDELYLYHDSLKSNKLQLVDAKLQEELDEYAASDEKDQVEELADPVELVYGILESKGVTIEEFKKVRLAKKDKRRGFQKRLFLISVDESTVI
jgi:predicted house-cleaning noncanonical NTP pyrophosphatase (MazG superfamily)